MPRAFFKSQFFKSQNHVLNHLAYLHAQSPLFSGTSNIPLETAQQMVSTFDRPCKWWFVFSLNRTDADRLQIDRGYFQQLLESQKGIWAKAYNIPPERLHIYASYHDLDHHPHVHVVLHGERPSDGFIHCPVGTELGEAFKHCRQTLKSAIANEIFRTDSENLKKDRSQQRQELNKELDRLLLEIGHSSHPIHPDIQRAMQQLSTQLAALPGKHVYGYLPADLKLQVDNLLEEVIKKDAQLAGMFETYKTTHRAMIDHLYVDSPITLDQKMADWENKFFHPVKGDDTRRHNIILQAAEALAVPARERNKKDTGSPHSWEEPEPFTPNEPEPSADTDDMEIFLDLDADAGAANEPNRKKEDLPSQPRPSLTDEQRKQILGIERGAVQDLERAFSGVLPDDVKKILEDLSVHQSEDMKAAALLQLSKQYAFVGDALERISDIYRNANLEPKETYQLLKYKLQQLSRYYRKDQGLVDLRALDREKSLNRKYQYYSKQLQNEVALRIDQDPALLSLVDAVRNAPKCDSKDGVELPISYNTLPENLQQEIDALLSQCTDSAKINAAADYLHEISGMDRHTLLYGSDEFLYGRKRHITGYGQKAVVHLLRDYIPLEEAKKLQEHTNEPGEPPGRKPATQEEQTALDQLMRTIQRTAEKEIQRHAPAGSLGEKLLAIRNLSNPTGPLPRYAKMSDQQQEIVRSAVQQIAALPAVQAALRGKPKELMQWSDAELLEYCTAPETSRLYRFVTGYAARATAKSPIDPLLPEIRRADYKLLCALDAALCNSLNAPMEDSRFRSAATDLARRIYTRDNDREALENPPQFYKQLFPPHQEEVWQMLSDYFQVGSVANALHTRKALSDIPDSFEHFTNDTRYLNLVLERLRERWESPDKPLVIKYQFSSLSYYHKTVAAIIRSGLYAIASTLKDDSQRTSSQSPKTGKKLQKKRIHHQTIEERHEQSHDR